MRSGVPGPPEGAVRGACAPGMREGGHSWSGVAALCCAFEGYLPLAASLSFEPAETFTL